MRVIAGFLGGRLFDSPRSSTHPMSEKMRGALFNSLGDIAGLDVLDAFAGSGAVGFEAISRGAKSVVAIESERSAQKTIASNIQKLELNSRVELIRSTVLGWSRRNKSKKFDIVTADPPYNDLTINIVETLPDHLKDDGTLVLSWPPKELVVDFNGLSIIKKKDYGDATLVFYQKNQ